MVFKGELPPLRVYAWKVCGKVHGMTVMHGYIKLYIRHKVYANIYVPNLSDLHAMIYKISEAARRLGVAVRLAGVKGLVFNLVKELNSALETLKNVYRSIKRAINEGSCEDLHLAVAALANMRDHIAKNLLPDLQRLYHAIEEAESRASRVTI